MSHSLVMAVDLVSCILLEIHDQPLKRAFQNTVEIHVQLV